MSAFTVTMTISVFVDANSTYDALDMATEGILSGDLEICGNAELNWHDAVVEDGHNFTIDEAN